LQAKLIRKQNWLLLIFLTQLTPAFFSYYYDSVLLLFGLLLTLKNPAKFIYFQKPLLTFLGLVIIIISLKYSFYILQGVYYPLASVFGKIFSDLRIFYIIGLVYYFKEIRGGSYSLFVKLIFIISFINFIVNMIGVFNTGLYLQILSYYFDPYSVSGYYEAFGKVTTSHVAALNNRFSGIFLQPATAGLVHSVIIFMGVISLIKIKFDWLIVIILCLTVFNGYVSGSTVFEMSVIFAPLFLFYKINSTGSKIALLGLMAIFFSLIIIVWHETILNFVNINILGLRFTEGSNNGRYFNSLNLSLVEVLFGHTRLTIGKGAGDSGYIIKFVNAGVVYIIFYYYALAYYLKKILSWGDLTFTGKTFSKAFFTFFMLAEIGFTPFSLPQSSVIIFFTLFLFLQMLKFNKALKV
jgi:hypothetical protein